MSGSAGGGGRRNVPAIAHAVYGLDGIELGVNLIELAADALDMGGDGVVVQYYAGGVHQLLAVFYVAGVFGQSVHNPEFGQGQIQWLLTPIGVQPVKIQQQFAALQSVLLLTRLIEGIQATEQSRDAGRQMGQADVFGEVIVGPQAQPRDGVQLTVCLLYTSPSPRDRTRSRMPSSA